MNRITIITTATFPWLTGPAINSLCLAACLARRGEAVRLLVPWVKSKKAQEDIFPPGMRFATPEKQEILIKHWLKKNFPGSTLELIFYPAVYLSKVGCIFPSGSLVKRLPETDVLILMEPEHLFFYQPWNLKKLKAQKICGIVHSNYSFYTRLTLGRLIARIYDAYDRFLKRRIPLLGILASTLKGPGHERLVHVNGVLPQFFSVANAIRENASSPFYFIGKFEWFKGFKALADFWSVLPPDIREVPIDCFGSGARRREIKAYCRKKGVTLNCHPPTLSPAATLAPYRAFINASVSEAMCTSSLEALAMGKWLVIPHHPSNEFFYRFSNCITYTDEHSFAAAIQKTLSRMPAPLSAGEAAELSWDRATQRLLEEVLHHGESRPQN